MKFIDDIVAFGDELIVIRRDLHAHAEIGFEEVRTSALVADKLAAWGIEAHRGLGKTGVVGVVHCSRHGATAGLSLVAPARPRRAQ